MGGRVWKDNEVEYLQENWGCMGYKQLAKKLNRTPSAIINKSTKLGLNGITSVSDYLVLNQISKIIKISYHKIKKWKDKGLKLKNKRLTLHRYFWYVRYEDLMLFLEENQDLWNASEVEQYAFGYEPDWLIQKRRKDKLKPKERKNWTNEEDKLLETMYYFKNMSYKEIAKELNRTYSSIKHRMNRLSQKRLKRVV